MQRTTPVSDGEVWLLEIVPRGAIFGEWNGFGAGLWKWLVLLGLNLRSFIEICALLQRMGRLGCGAESSTG
jgi:hypothetical protein